MAAAGRQPASATNAARQQLQINRRLQRSLMSRLDTFDQFGDVRIGNVSVSDAADDGYAYDRASGAIRCVWCNAAITSPENADLSVIRQLHNDRCPRGPPPEEPALSEDQVEGSIHGRGDQGPYAEVDLSLRGGPVPAMQRVRDDNERMREEMRCKRCSRSQVETLFLPCRHLVACEACADQVEDCFMCDAKILGTVRIYLN